MGGPARTNDHGHRECEVGYDWRVRVGEGSIEVFNLSVELVCGGGIEIRTNRDEKTVVYEFRQQLSMQERSEITIFAV